MKPRAKRSGVRGESFYRTDYPIWVLTGGGVEPKETPEKAAIREAIEESGFKVKLINSIGRYRMLDKNNVTIKTTYVYEGRVLGGEYKPEFEGNVGRWFSVDSLPADITSSTRRKIVDVLNYGGRPFVKELRDEILLRDNLGLILRHPKVLVKFFNFKFR